MSDRFAGQIWIGGQLSRTARLYPNDKDDTTTILEGLIGALALDGASNGWGETPIDDKCTEEDLLASCLSNEVLHLKNDEACLGEFEETEEFCIEYGIPFDRNSEHCGEHDGENLYWRPGMAVPMTTYTDSDGKEVVDGDTVRKALFSLERDIVTDSVPKAKLLLRAICPELPPNLKEFKIID